MRYAKICHGMYVVEKEIPASKAAQPTRQNHVWLYDRSGSMSHTLPGLANDLIARAKELPVGDTITLGWFSGEGQFNFILKGYKITDSRDYSVLERAIRLNESPLGCTCFSEILRDTETVVQDLSVISPEFTLLFLTDGFPVVSNYNREIETIKSAVQKLNGKITAALLVGYSDHYNKNLLLDMAEWIGGSVCHSGDLREFSVSLTEFIQGSRRIGQRQSVEVPPGTDLAFTMAGSVVSQYGVDRDQVTISANKTGSTKLYSVASKAPRGGKEITVTEDLVRSDDEFAAALYATALVMIQRTKYENALSVLSEVGDVRLIDEIANAFTPDEYGKIERSLQDAMTQPKKRFQQGRSTQHRPADDAFCLLDLLDVLAQDPKAAFYPNHENFVYRRVGRSAEVREGFAKFKPDPDVRCAINAFSWHQTRLNLSVLARLHGKVELRPRPIYSGKPESTANDFGLQNPYPVGAFRNYTLVRDGLLNVQKLPLTCSHTTWRKLKQHDLCGAWEGETGVLVVDLTLLPVVNRAIAKRRTSAHALCEAAVGEVVRKANLKAFKWLLGRDDEPAAPATFSEAQQQFLVANGVDPRTNTYSPPTDAVRTDDYYDAKTFKVAVKGFSSLPKIQDVQQKLATGKKLTPSETLIAQALARFDASGVATQETAVRVAWLERQIELENDELRKLRRTIQETKFAIALGKQWFEEFQSRDDNTLTVNGYACTISVGTERVPL